MERLKFRNISVSFFLSLSLFLGGSGGEEGSGCWRCKKQVLGGWRCWRLREGRTRSPLLLSELHAGRRCVGLRSEPETAGGAQEFHALQSRPLPLLHRPQHLKRQAGCLVPGSTTSSPTDSQTAEISSGRGTLQPPATGRPCQELMSLLIPA